MAAKKSNLGLVVAGLLIGILTASMDGTIVATAMGTIVAELGGLDQFVWVTSAYMVAEMAGMPIFGKLSDMFGRKRFFIFGLITFLGGSILCGTADNIVQLACYRAVQGIGGGALIPIAFTIMFDVFPPEQRGKMGGLFGATFGLSSIFGPLLGAYITDYINWRWVFYINLPLGVLAFIFIAFFYKESIRHAKQKIDWAGAVTLVGAVVCIMFALELGGHYYDWGSGVILSLFAGFAVLFAAFLYVETKAEEPIISFEMFRQRLFAASSLIGLFTGATFIVATVYIPIYIQGVQGGSATNSGLLLLPMMLGTTVSAQLGGFLSSKISYRSVMLLFSVIFVLGFILLATLTPETSRLAVTIIMIIVGLGVGASFSVLGMATIHHFDDTRRGSAQSTNAFLRAFGMTLGIAVLGIVQRNLLSGKLEAAFRSGGSGAEGAGAGGFLPSGLMDDPRALLSPEVRANIPSDVLDTITGALSSSIAQTFAWTLIPAVLSLAFVFMMSGERLVRHEKQRQAAEHA